MRAIVYREEREDGVEIDACFPYHLLSGLRVETDAYESWKKGSSSSSQMFREPVSCHVAPTRQERPAVSQSGAMHFGLFLSSQTHSSLLVAVKGSSSSSTTKQRQHKTRLKKATAAGPIHIPTQHLPSVLNLIHSQKHLALIAIPSSLALCVC